VAAMGGLAMFGLDPGTARFTRRVTGNVLHAFADGPAAPKYPAYDNLEGMDEWAGDPIGSQRDLWPPVRL
jgi:hypothetical protein